MKIVRVLVAGRLPGEPDEQAGIRASFAISLSFALFPSRQRRHLSGAWPYVIAIPVAAACDGRTGAGMGADRGAGRAASGNAPWRCRAGGSVREGRAGEARTWSGGSSAGGNSPPPERAGTGGGACRAAPARVAAIARDTRSSGTRLAAKDGARCGCRGAALAVETICRGRKWAVGRTQSAEKPCFQRRGQRDARRGPAFQKNSRFLDGSATGSGAAGASDFTGLRGKFISSRANLTFPSSTQPRMPGSQVAPCTRWQMLSRS